MKSYHEKESKCALAFAESGDCFHLWTPENFEVIFTCDDDFKAGMGISGICAKLFPDIRIFTFELMTNHLHIAASGSESRLNEMFISVRTMLIRHSRANGRVLDWKRFEARIRKLNSLDDLRNVIVYDNRNGFLVSPDHSPYSYPWGANKYYFNPDAKRLALATARGLSIREKRNISHSHIPDGVDGLLVSDGYVSPMSFCDIEGGERMFRDASHYFHKISKNIEANKAIASEIGEGIYYTDDELFAAICSISVKEYSEPIPSRLGKEAKIALAKVMRYDYNASAKQICRMLKLPISVISALGL